MKRHLRNLSLLLTFMGAVYLVGTVLLAIIGAMTFHTAIQAGADDPAALRSLVFGFCLLILFAAFGLFHIRTDRDFRQDTTRARKSMWILAILNLGNVPLGTIFGIYAIWILSKTPT